MMQRRALLPILTQTFCNTLQDWDLKPQIPPLGSSGYRKFNVGDFEVLFDSCPVLPAYQPGHTHADTLQVLLRYKNKDVVVDTGISTYEKTSRRHEETFDRSTQYRNC